MMSVALMDVLAYTCLSTVEKASFYRFSVFVRGDKHTV